MLARDLDAGPVFVLEDEAGGGYASILTSHFQLAAKSLDLPLAGWASWDPDASSYRGLVARIARARPGAVFLSGIAFDNGGPLVRQLREGLGKDVALLAPDAFGVVSFLLREAGPAAEGMYVSFGGAPNSALGPAGERFIDAFAATQPGGVVPSYSAAYAGQAAEVLLDAIARSDGTRRSVTRELVRTRVSGGILGSFRIDRNGDASTSSITILRVTGRRAPSPTLLADHIGTVIDRVLTPPARLTAVQLRSPQ